MLYFDRTVLGLPGSAVDGLLLFVLADDRLPFPDLQSNVDSVSISFSI